MVDISETVKQDLSSNVNSHRSDQDVPFCVTQRHYQKPAFKSCHKLLVSSVCLASCFLKISFNIILPSMSRSYDWSVQL